MHLIAASTLSRADHYAAGLGLSRSEWRFVSDLRHLHGYSESHIHALPGVTPEIYANAVFQAAKPGSTLIDHTENGR